MVNNTAPAQDQAWRSANPAPIKRAIGRYQLLDLLGAGAMGTVYRGKDPDLGRDVAVKLMSPAVSADPQLRDRFHREARTAGSLQHPNIITIYEFGEFEGQLYIAMEYVAGSDLTDVISKSASLNLLAKLGIGLDVLAGLEYAHARGITHRDIKPGNIRLTADGRAKIMDFGIAHLAESELTNTGFVLGTPSYMAPELLKGGDPSGATDIFSVGAVLYELLTLKKPFDADTTHAVFYKVLSEDPQPVHEIDPSIPRRIREIVRKSMAKVPETRYQSADDMAAELKAACLAISTADDSTVVVRPNRRTLKGRAKSVVATAVAGFGLFWAWDAPAKMVTATQNPILEPLVAAMPTSLGRGIPGDTLIPTMRNNSLTRRFEAQNAGVPVAMLAEGDSIVAVADSLENAGAISQAVLELSKAATKWAESEAIHRTITRAAARRRAQQLADNTPIDTGTPIDALPIYEPVTVPVLDPVLSDDQQIAAVVSELEAALESRDTVQLRAVYPRLAENEAVGWGELFRTSNDLDMALTIRTLRSIGDSANADVTGDYSFTNDSGVRLATMQFTLTLIRTDGEWHIAHLGKTEFPETR